jgi:hypothetical protein
VRALKVYAVYRCKLALPLLILPVGVPLALLLGPPVYMGWDYPLRWAVNIFGLVWLGASVWLALKSPALVPPPAHLR